MTRPMGAKDKGKRLRIDYRLDCPICGALAGHQCKADGTNPIEGRTTHNERRMLSLNAIMDEHDRETL